MMRRVDVIRASRKGNGLSAIRKMRIFAGTRFSLAGLGTTRELRLFAQHYAVSGDLSISQAHRSIGRLNPVTRSAVCGRVVLQRSCSLKVSLPGKGFSDGFAG